MHTKYRLHRCKECAKAFISPISFQIHKSYTVKGNSVNVNSVVKTPPFLFISKA